VVRQKMKYYNIDKEKRIIFLHPPRCGGKSIEKVLFERNASLGSADHATANEWVKQIGEDEWDQYFKFGFSRNPWDRCVSNYLYLRNNVKKIRMNTFKKFIDTLEKKSSRIPDITAYSQVDFFIYKDRPIDFIGRFENYQEDFEKLKTILNLPNDLELPHLNKSKGVTQKYVKFYDNQSLIDRVARIYKKDIEYFGYEFGK
jgi:hypothetical protein